MGLECGNIKGLVGVRVGCEGGYRGGEKGLRCENGRVAADF